MNELALFAGAGGGILGGQLLGWRTVCAVEIEPYAASVLVQRQNDGLLPTFPIWDDVRTFDGRPWRGIVDVVSGGFPCQDISTAGKGAGIDGSRSGIWVEMARIISEVRPAFAFVENSPMLVSRGLGRILGDLAEMGYDARWGVLGAHHVGAPHERERIYLFANANSEYGKKRLGILPQLRNEKIFESKDEICSKSQQWTKTVTRIAGSDHGMAARVDRIKAIGNGQVPQCAAKAWEILTNQQKPKNNQK